MWQQKQSRKLSSYRESLKSLEADIHHANSLAASLPRYHGGDCVQMRLSYSAIAPFILFLVEWMDYSCTDALPRYLDLLHVLVYKVYDEMPCLSSKERKASLREFYAVIYPSLRQLEAEINELEDDQKRSLGNEALSRKIAEERSKQCDSDLEKEDECEICMEGSTSAKMVLPNCGHALCSNCFHNWNVRSQSCPFCRGSLKRVNSSDLWVMISTSDVLDTIALAKENLRLFYIYLENLPPAVPETHAFLIDYMI